MANHGVVTYGPDLLTAFLRMETTEHFAQVSLVTECLGKQNLLSQRDVEKLVTARTHYAAGARDGAPADDRRRRGSFAIYRTDLVYLAGSFRLLSTKPSRRIACVAERSVVVAGRAPAHAGELARRRARRFFALHPVTCA